MPTPRHKPTSTKNIDLPVAVRIPFELLLIVIVIAIAAALAAATLLPAFAGVNKITNVIQTKMNAYEATFHRIRFPQTSSIYAADGSLLTTVNAGQNRTVVSLNKIAPVARDAVLAIEDHDFYSHGALQPISIARAAIANIAAGTVTQGGSTITQQLVKNAEIGSDAQTFQRKFEEAALAVRMEQEYSKDQILELYMNEVYLANGVYGIGTASQFYFGIPASKLSLTQSALLAGIINSPENLDPIHHKKASKARRNVVLEEMAKYGFITAQAAAKAEKKPVVLHVNRMSNQPVNFFTHHLIYTLLNLQNHEWDKLLGTSYKQRLNTLGSGGFKIYTTYDPKMQAMAQDAASNAVLPSNADVGIATVVPGDGAVPVLLSGRNYARDQLDLAAPELTKKGALLGIRQPGSSMKPYTLVTAFEQGISPQTTYATNSPMHLQGWDSPCSCVYNAEPFGGFGNVNLYTATADSINVVFAQLVLQVGASNVWQTAYDMGVRTSLYDESSQAVDSITLGSIPISPLEQASGYATLADHGMYCKPYYVTRIVGPNGHVIYRHKPECKQVISPPIADLTTQLLEGVVTGGTGTAAQLGRPVAGKTGTSEDSADLWFVGYTPQLSSAVWVGNPHGRQPYTGMYGGTVAAPIWHNYMARALQGMPSQGFSQGGHVNFKPVKGNVPDVVGMDQAKATQILQKAKYQVAVSTVDSTKPKGQVVSQNPAAGANAPAGATVTIDVSNGNAPTTKVPGVQGVVLYQAQQTLKAAGFGVSVQYVDVTQKDKNRIVLSQSPGGGSTAKPGSTVTLTVGNYVGAGGGGGGGGGSGGGGGGSGGGGAGGGGP